MVRGLPDVPRLSHFPELNVRTYVENDGRPGVWFFSLDAANSLAVWGARTFLGLPYYRAKMVVEKLDGDWISYLSERNGASSRARFIARYRPNGAVFEASPASLEYWLTERYCLYSAHRDGSLSRLDIHHARWPLQPAEAAVDQNTMISVLSLEVSGPPLLHFSKNQHVIAWAPERLGSFKEARH